MPVARRRTEEPPAPQGEGSGNVVAHPAFREVPKCQFTLRTTEAQAEFDTLARMLFDAGRLTAALHRVLSSYAMQFDTITAASAEGKQVRGSWFAQLDKARSQLGLDDLDQPIAAPRSARANRYARTGFPNRR